jgi:GATA-binding protein, other eukaryote
VGNWLHTHHPPSHKKEGGQAVPAPIFNPRTHTMAADEASPFSTHSPPTAMNPTITEHDFRFPRRPLDSSAAGGAADRPSANHASPGTLQLDLDFSGAGHMAQHDVLGSSMFPAWKDGMAARDESLEQMQVDDPLATQVWRFFSKTKQNLPSQERMENLTWRMMHMKLRKQQQEEERARYVLFFFSSSPCLVFFLFCLCWFRRPKTTAWPLLTLPPLPRPTYSMSRGVGNAAGNAPSGIAQQLRQTTTDHSAIQTDPMNLDDFIFSEIVATPAGLPTTPASPEAVKAAEDKAAHGASAIPIKSRKSAQPQHFVPQSVPVPPHHGNRDEFGYVNRHHRKTSIDDRRVSTILDFLPCTCMPRVLLRLHL